LKFDPGLLVVVLLSTFAAWPLLTRPSLPTFTDGEQHAYRIFEVLSAWKAGVPYLRWAPDLFAAFGYPVFNYYAPLAYYLGAAYAWLCCSPVTGPVAGVKFVMVAAAYLGASGMYLFVRDQWGHPAGIISAAAFALSPYIIYIEPLARGDAPEALALALAPWVLWAFARLRCTTSLSHRCVAAFVLAALIISHNLMALIFFGLLLVWLAWELLGKRWPNQIPERSPDLWPILRALGLAIGLSLGLTAFLWLPAVLERNAVQFHNATVGFLDFRREFVSPLDLLRPAMTADLDVRLKRVSFQLGLAQWILAALGTSSILIARPRRATLLFFASVGLVSAFLATTASLPIWETFPALAFLQFPWRLLGPAAVSLSILAGAAENWVRRYLPSGTFIFCLVAVAACVIAAQPLLDPLPWSDFGPVTAVRVVKAGLDWMPGTTATNEFLPVTVHDVPAPQPTLMQAYEMDRVDKVNRAALPESTQVNLLDHGPERDRWRIGGPTSFTLQVYTFYFPGWTAYIDGIKTPVTPSEPEGWITLPVPSGDHEISLQFENTLPRWLGWGISSLAALITLALTFWNIRFPSTKNAHPERSTGQSKDRRREPQGGALRRELEGAVLPWPSAMRLGLIVIAGLGLRYIADQNSWWRLKPEGDNRPIAQHESSVSLESNITLIAYDLPLTSGKPGSYIPLTLYWEAQTRVTRNLRVFVHFIGPDGQLWGQSDRLRPGGFDSLPTGRWPFYRPVRDDHEAVLRPDAPPGEYQIRAGLWDGYTGARMHVLDSNGNVTDQDSVVLTATFVVQP
jgi:hypothetical protein